jgi:hypothetical protein
MKKLNLGKLKLAMEEVLQRNQLVTIYGGSGSDCAVNACGAIACCTPSLYWCVNGYCTKR